MCCSTSKGERHLKPSREYLDHLLAARDVESESYYRKLASWQTLD